MINNNLELGCSDIFGVQKENPKTLVPNSGGEGRGLLGLELCPGPASPDKPFGSLRLCFLDCSIWTVHKVLMAPIN